MLDVTDIIEAEGLHEDDTATTVSLSDLPEPVREFLLPLVEEYRALQAEIAPRDKRKKTLMKEIAPLLDPLSADRVLDSEGRPLTRREYRVSETVDETKLLEAGIPIRVIEACRVRKVSVYYKVSAQS